MIRRLFSLAGPLFIAQLAVAGMAITDTVMAGRAGTDQMAVVAVGANLLLLGIMAIYGVLMVVSPQSAAAFVARQKRLPVLLRQSILLGLLTALVVMAFLSVMLFILHDLMQATLFSGVVFFILLGFPGLLLAGVYFALRFFWEGLHRTRWTAIISIVLFLVNIPLDWLFVIKLKMGGAGCALATSLSFLLAVIISMVIYRNDKKLSMAVSRFFKWTHMDYLVFTRLMRLGVPASLALLSEVSLFMLLALLIAPFGVVALAGHQIAINITSALYVLPFSLSLALSIEMGRLSGLEDVRRRQRLVRTGLGLAVLLGGALSALTWLTHTLLPVFFSEDPAVRHMASLLLLYAAAYQVADAVQMAAAGLLRGLGETKRIMAVTLFSHWGVGLPFGALMAWGVQRRAEGYWMGIVVALTLAAILLVLGVRRACRHRPI